MCTGLFLVQLDVTIINVALPRLRDSLSAEVGGLQWSSTATRSHSRASCSRAARWATASATGASC